MQLGIFHESINKAAERADKLRAYRGNGCACYAPAERNDEQQIEPNIEGRGKEQEHQRRDGVAHAAQKRADEVIEELCADAGKNDGAIGVGRAIDLGAPGVTLIHASIGSSSTSASAVRRTVSTAERAICVVIERRTPAGLCAPTLQDVTTQEAALTPKANCRKMKISEDVSLTPATSCAESV